jgi:hypothetical protein
MLVPSRGTDNQDLLIQDCISSDTWLRDAIAATLRRLAWGAITRLA